MSLFRKLVGVFQTARLSIRKRLLGGLPAVYVEDVFSTYLYTGNGSTQTITNGIDLSTKGGLVWIKNRTQAASHYLQDTVRGANNYISTNNTNAQASLALNTVFNTDGFSQNNSFGGFNGSGDNYASWTFRKQPKFFDVVTYTGNSTNRTIAHNLGSVPGCIIVKDLLGGNWNVYHRSLANTQAIELNSSSAVGSAPTYWNSTTPTSTVFSLGTDSQVNYTGHDYVAYLFAHDAGGFGLTGTDNVISCGIAYSNSSVNLGFEPQWILDKDLSSGFNWNITDNMRGNGIQSANVLKANSSDAEVNSGTTYFLKPTATGFDVPGSYATGSGFIYIAIRRGPMKVPTSGASVYGTTTWVGSSGTKTTSSPTANFATGYAAFIKGKDYAQDWGQFDQLRGVRPFLSSDNTSAETDDGATNGGLTIWPDTIYLNGTSYFGGGGDGTGKNYIAYLFKRAPSFFDEVCYSGDGTDNRSINHNLGVVPELFLVKRRNSGGSGDVNWGVYSNARISANHNLILNSDIGWYYAGVGGWFGTGTLSATLFPAGRASGSFGNLSGGTYVAYLFATCAGVSKVGSYTGTGTTKQVDCGFTGGARFVLIKRTDSTGDWYVWDSARGIVSGNDPYLLLNSTAVEVTNTDYIDPYSAGFELSSTAPAALNANGGTYIFLAIA